MNRASSAAEPPAPGPSIAEGHEREASAATGDEEASRGAPGSVAAVILAAGLSTRFGDEIKQLARIEGESLLRRTTRIVLASSCRPVIVVLPSSTALRREIEDLEVQVVVNPSPEDGLSSSVRCGLAALHTDRASACATGSESGARLAGSQAAIGSRVVSASAVIFVPIDQPGLSAELLERLVDQHRHTPTAIVQPQSNEHPGSPTLFPQRLFTALAQLRGDEGGRQLIRGGEPALRIEATSCEVLDLDTPEALADFLRRQRQESRD